VIVAAQALAEYPEHLRPTEATSIWMQYMTAYGALIEIGRLKKGEFVLITAASSSAGLAAIDTVKFEGAIPIAVPSDTRAPKGAHHSRIWALGDAQRPRSVYNRPSKR
jgi:NADPH:quinone reductase-like Zn-dependent oxidoreductase